MPMCAEYVLAISIPCGVSQCIGRGIEEPGLLTYWVMDSVSSPSDEKKAKPFSNDVLETCVTVPS